VRSIGRISSRIKGREPKVFDSFAEADAGADTYEDREIVGVIARKTESFRKSITHRIRHRLTVQDLLVLHVVGNGNPIRVLDFGGACGATFFEIQALAPGLIERWTVIETEAMVDQASRFAGDLISFTVDLDHGLAQRPDVVLAKGSLHYTQDPGGLLARFISSDAPWIYMSRTPAFDRPHAPAYIRQATHLRDHGPGSLEGIKDRSVTVAATLLSWPSYLEAARKARLVWEFEEGNAWRLRGETVRDMGALFHRL
jgi:putative methyltransferase (TIGR04325 family)